MKISNIETYPVWSGTRNYMFVVVDTDEGIYGVGECGIAGRELASLLFAAAVFEVCKTVM